MALIATRVSNYPIVGETCKRAAGAYNWVKEANCIGPIVQTAEDTAARIIKPIVGSSLGQKVDELAVQHILDPVEAICTYVKDTSSDLLLSPALDLAEACANVYLSNDQNTEAVPKDASNYDRIIRLKCRTTAEVLRVLHVSVDSAQSILSTLSKSLPVILIKDRLAKVISLCELVYSTAKTLALPVILNLITTVLEKLRSLNDQLQKSNKLSWIDLRHLVVGLEHVKSLLDKPEDSQEVLSLSTLRSRHGLSKLNVLKKVRWFKRSSSK